MAFDLQIKKRITEERKKKEEKVEIQWKAHQARFCPFSEDAELKKVDLYNDPSQKATPESWPVTIELIL